ELLPPAKRRPFVGPSRTNTPRPPSAFLPPAPAAARRVIPLDRGPSCAGAKGLVRGAATGIASSGADALPAGGRRARKNVDGIAVPPFRLTFGGGSGGGSGSGGAEKAPEESAGHGASLPLQQQQQQQQQQLHQEQTQQGQERSKPERRGGKGGGGWPTRAVWVPNGFEDALEYRGVFSRAMQEEMQLVLDETVVTRFHRAKEKIDTLSTSTSSVGPGRGRGGGGRGMGRTDRRDPLWRQKLFRGDGVHYYSSVSLFRAGGGGGGRADSGGWESKSDGKRRKQWRGRGWGSGEDGTDDKDNTNKGDGGGGGGKMYLKILNLSESKEASSSYGKGDVWALSATGRFLDHDKDGVVFCRSQWHGVSSQGMLSVGPLGDGSEALRLEAMAGRGNGGRGGSSGASSVHAIRCFNAQTDLSALDLFRNGYVKAGDEDEDEAVAGSSVTAANPVNGSSSSSSSSSNTTTTRGKNSVGLDSVPVLPFLLSGGLADAGDTGNDIRNNNSNNGIGGSKSSDNDINLGEGDDGAFDLCLTRRERDTEVSKTVEAFGLNEDQARLLWRCAGWFRTAEGDDEDKGGGRDTERGSMDGKQEACRKGRETGVEEGGVAPVVLVHGVFGSGKSTSLVALCVMIDSIASADARARVSRGLAHRPKAEQVRVLLASGTNVAVDRVLQGLVAAGFDDLARLGSHRRTHKSLLEWVVHSSPPGRDAKQAVQNELQAMLKTAAVEERGNIERALRASKAESFATDQARRLREARVTGVTCASATIPLLTRTPPPTPTQPRPRGVAAGGRSTNLAWARTTGLTAGGVKSAAGRRLGVGG
ncbi:unnamed protein product, partial [Scytosiphon promiscuus]